MNKPPWWCPALTVLLLFTSRLAGQSDSNQQPDSLSDGVSIEDLLGERGNDAGSGVREDLDEETPGGRRSHRFEFRSRISGQLQVAEGYLDGTYRGSKLRLYHRLRLRPVSEMMGAILMTKDPGERSVIDCISGHVMVNEIGLVRRLVAGDYALAVGQGVASWRSFGSSKGGSSPVAVKREGPGLVPVFFEGETQPYRGFAVEFGREQYSLTVLSSWRALSASVDSTGVVGSIRTDGSFRTIADGENRNNLTEQTIGMRLCGRLGDVHSLGMTMIRSDYSRYLFIDDGRRFAGTRISIVSADWDMQWDMAEIFGEWTMSGNRAGGLGGILLKPDRHNSIVVVLRHYPLNFYRPHASCMAEQTSATNETGEYLGLRFHPLRGITLSSYFDRFTLPEPAWSSRFPAHGMEYLVEAVTRLFPRMEISVRYRQKETTSQAEVQGTGGYTLRVDALEKRSSIRSQITYEVVHGVTTRFRGEWIVHSVPRINHEQRGFLLLQDLTVHHPVPLSWSLHTVYFRTQGYDSRLYDFESEMPGSFSFVPLYGRGIRWSMSAYIEVGEIGQISLRYGETIRDDVRRIGSGADQLPGNYDNRFGIQIDIGL